ncbi:DUF2252 domain-containing protein [Agromyces seonyuensis]|uniref:DUF2252 domain-containing protein n=1 Tax=Agromyces seonyuensis TaxID=2662446 RepID=A0A6I4NZR5_9MICO|nr:DUF2252 domain-containing protein [Agromyces seonyuensis]MWB97925.1 DUF2252 domain-containing protein [Agromyces seonyuensis]
MTDTIAFQSEAAERRRDRRADGRAVRDRLPLADLAVLPPVDRDPIATLEEQAKTRVPRLIALRHGRMAASPFAFYRGAAALMADDLRAGPDTGLVTWLCGDAHLSNVGAYASPERTLVLDLNDFDETSKGPFEWDVKRMAASFEIAGRTRGFDEATRRGIVADLARAYAEAARDASEIPTLELFTAHVDVQDVLSRIAGRLSPTATKRLRKSVAKARTRNSRQAAASLADRVDGLPRFRSEPPLLVSLDDVAAEFGVSTPDATRRMEDILAAYIATLPPERKRILERFRLVDAAMKVVGVGSVGTRAWLALLVGNGPKDVLVLQAKEAQRSVLDDASQPSVYPNEGERVVHGQRIMQALGDPLLGWTRAEGLDGVERDFYLRQFRDWKGGASTETMEAETMTVYAEYCGLVLARAHARGTDAARISGYLGRSKEFGEALAEFSVAYADRTELDHARLLQAIADGRLEAVAE